MSLSRKADGSAGDADYAVIGAVYRGCRVADPRIAAFVHAALGDARTVLNVGAGTGSYEPVDRDVTAAQPVGRHARAATGASAGGNRRGG